MNVDWNRNNYQIPCPPKPTKEELQKTFYAALQTKQMVDNFICKLRYYEKHRNEHKDLCDKHRYVLNVLWRYENNMRVDYYEVLMAKQAIDNYESVRVILE